MTQLELDDIQGYLLRGYAHMMYSRFVFLQVKEAAAVKNWLAKSWNSFTTAQHVTKDKEICDTHLNIAFTNKGLLALGLKQQNLDEFSVEFREGMVTPHRTRLLGDFGSSSPDNWQWGVDSAQPIHIALMVFGRDPKTCLDYYQELKSQFGANGLEEVLTIDGQTLPQNKEHFGFRDGISQPIIEGSGRKGPENDYVKAGEFVFGYKKRIRSLS
jgi:deferrochelatase/peroxidase EfeB